MTMRIKNVHGEDRIVPWLGDRLVLAGEVVDIPDEDVWAYTMQAGWEPADDETQAVHDDAAVVAVAAQIVEDGVPVAEPDPDAPREVWGGYVIAADLATVDELAGMSVEEIRDAYTAPTEEPKGNATRDEWVEWVVSQGLATGEDVSGLSRDQVRDTYKSTPVASDTTDGLDSISTDPTPSSTPRAVPGEGATPVTGEPDPVTDTSSSTEQKEI